MGFNISGIAIDSSYAGKLEDLQNDLNLTFEYVEDVIFETASANWTDEGVAFIHFTDKSTILFLNTELTIEPYIIPNRKVLSFALSETSMAFSLNYSEGNEVKRYIMEHEGKKMSEEGEPFAFEPECGDASEIIWRKLDDVLGMPFHDIDLGAPSKKYSVKYGRPQEKKAQPPESKKVVRETISSDNTNQSRAKSGCLGILIIMIAFIAVIVCL